MTRFAKVSIPALILAALPAGFLAQAAAPAGHYLVWYDEFDGTSLNTGKWGNWLLGARRDAINTAAAVSVGAGSLTITTYTTNGTHYTGMISTDGKFRARYGYLEARIDFNDSPGMWSAFWLQSPTMGSYIGDPSTAGAEIDACEHRSTDGANNIDGQVQVNIHWDGYGADHKSTGSGNIGSGLGAGYHTYGFNWTPANYAFLIDDVSRYTTGSGHSDRTEFFILSSEVQNGSWAGSIPAGGYGNLAASTTKLNVDYVRYYAPTTTVFWTGASSPYWTNAGNWLASMVPTAVRDVVFSQLGSANFNTSLGQDLSIHSLAIWESSPVTVNGNTLTLGSGGVDMISANNNATINSAVNLGAAQTWSVGPSRTLTLNGTLSGASAFTKAGYGSLILNASNSFSGTLNADTASATANDGALRIARNSAIASVPSPIYLANNNSGRSTLQFDGSAGGLSVAQAIRLSCRNHAFACLQNIAGNNTLLGELNILQGGSNIVVQSDSGTLTLAAPLRYIGSLAGARAYSFSGNGAISVSAPILDSTNGSVISLAKSGSGTLSLSGSNTFTGATRILAGTLQLLHSNALQSTTVDLNAADTGSLTFNVLSANLGGLTGSRNLSFGSAAVWSLGVGNNGQSCSYAGSLGGSVDLRKLGPGTFTLGGSNAFLSAALYAGTLKLSQEAIVHFSFDSVSGSGNGAMVTNTGTAGAAMNGVVVNPSNGVSFVAGRVGNALSLNGAGSFIAVSNRVTATDGNTPGSSWTLALWLKTAQAGAGYAYQGDGGWVSGNTAFYLNQGNTTSGTRAGAVRWGGGWLTGNAALNDNNWHFIAICVSNGSKTIYVDGNLDATFSGATWGSASVGNQFWVGGTADPGDGVARMNGLLDEVYLFNRPLGQVEVQALMNNALCSDCFTAQVPPRAPVSVAAAALFDLNGTSARIASLGDLSASGGRVTNSAPVPVSLTLSNSAGVATFSGRINDSSAAEAISVVKAGSFTQVLAGTNNYRGTTLVAGGTLRLDGALGTNALIVAAGTLSGNGRISGPVSVQSGGTLAPGTSIGALTVSNTLTLAGNTVIELNQAAHTNDSVRGATSVTYGGTLSLTNLAGLLGPADTFKLFYADAYSGAFASLVPAIPRPGFAWNTNTLAADGTLRIDATLNPSPANLIAFLAGNQLDLSWPGDHTGWRLQVQTNTLDTGLGTNWVDLPGAEATNHIMIPIAPQNGAVFYRMIYP